jgi:hypothetical protein
MDLANVEKGDSMHLYNLNQLKDMYGISVKTWREYIKRRKLRAFKIGRSYFVSKYDLATFINEREV